MDQKILSYNDLNLFDNITYTKEPILKRSSSTETFIVDYGSFYTKAGSIYDELPTLLCKSKTLKTKRNNQSITLSGNQITSEYYKIQCKKIIDNGIAQQKELEDFNDYIFESFQINRGDRLLYTEPLGISLKQRSLFFEQFFELYELQEVLPCVDSIAASFQTLNQYGTNSGLVISIGHNKTTILPFINSDLNVSRVREIDVGVRQMKNTLMKLFEVKYKNFNNLFNPKFGNGFCFYQKNAFVAPDYNKQLQYYMQSELLEIPNQQRDQNLFAPVIIQPYQQQSYTMSDKEIQQLEQKRQEQAQKLLMIKEQKRLEKNQKIQLQLQKMEELMENFEQQGSDMEQELVQNGYQNLDDLKRKIKNLKVKLGIITKEELNRDKFNLINVPDEQLTQEQRRAKQYQQMHKKAELKREEKRRKRDLEKKRINELIQKNPEKYLDELKSKRQKLKKKIKKIKMYKEDNFLKRQKEQKIIENLDNHLEGNEQVIQNKQLRKFYENIMEVSSDYEIYEKKVQKIEEDILQIDPTFDPYYDDQNIYLQRKYMRPNLTYVGTDIIRSTESLFKPYLIGNNQKGILESIKCSLKTLNDESLNTLLNNVFVVGGGSSIQGLQQRIKNDLLVNFNYRGIQNVNLHIVENPLYLPYQGIRNFWLNFEDQFKQNCVYTKQEYDEYGPELFKNCPIGNWQLNQYIYNQKSDNFCNGISKQLKKYIKQI